MSDDRRRQYAFNYTSDEILDDWYCDTIEEAAAAMGVLIANKEPFCYHPPTKYDSAFSLVMTDRGAKLVTAYTGQEKPL
jgi:hypothetical protein